MHRHEEANIAAQPQYIAAAIEIDEAALVRIRKHRYRAELYDRQCRGEGRDRRGEHPIAWAASQSAQRDLNGVEPAGHSDGMLQAPARSQNFLQCAHLLAQYVSSAHSYSPKRV